MAENDKKSETIVSQDENTVEYHYIKGRDFRSFRADGALGGWTARGYLHVVLYSERAAIPQRTVMELDEETGVLREVDREGKTGVVREMEADIFLDQATLRELYEWLGDKLRTLDDLKKRGLL